MSHRRIEQAANPRLLDSTDSGLYILWLALAEDQRIRIGLLGTYDFRAGLYAYVGSAQRRRSARIQRHLLREKPAHWHIDYLRPYGQVVAVSLVDGTRSHECQLASRLTVALGARVAVLRFGASDCRCPGHLLVLPDRRLLDATGFGQEGAAFDTAPWRRLGFLTHLASQE